MKVLLDSKADVSLKNQKGFNCLHHAAIRGYLGYVRFVNGTCDVLFVYQVFIGRLITYKDFRWNTVKDGCFV